MKTPRTFSTGDPSYFVSASTCGNVNPTAFTTLKTAAASAFADRRAIAVKYQEASAALVVFEPGAPVYMRVAAPGLTHV